MSIELRMLAYSVALLFALMLIQGWAGIRAQGGRAMAGNRDNLKPPSVFQARTKRLVDNMRENLWFFAPLVLIAAQLGLSNSWTEGGAQLFFGASVAHAASYIAGWPYIRAVFWLAGVVGYVLIFLALFGVLT